MTTPLVSVVIPVYNAEKHLRSTLDSVLGQTYESIEIVAVDDESTDSSAEILKQYENRVRYIHRRNGGPAAARNTGIDAAAGELIAFIDADDQWEPTKLAAQVNFIKEHGPNVALVHTDVVNIFDENEDDPPSKNLPAIMDQRSAFERLFRGNYISTSSVLCRAQLFKSLGNFDESMRLFAVEDYDMWLRVACHHAIGYLPGRYLRYRIHPEGISRNINRSYQNEKNVVDKWYGGSFECIQRLTISKRARYRHLMQAWGDDLSWSGEHGSAIKIYWRGIREYRVSAPLIKGILKCAAKLLTRSKNRE